MVPRPLPLLPPPSPQRHEVGARARVAELLQLLHAPLGCPGGTIADEPEEHSLVADEFGMYYKSPEIAPLAQPANPLEATTGEATTGAGAPTGGAPAGTAMSMEDLGSGSYPDRGSVHTGWPLCNR